MSEKSSLADTLRTRLKQMAPEAILHQTFYDKVSERAFVTLVFGLRRVILPVPARLLDKANPDEIDVFLKRAVASLQRSPIG